MEPFNNAEMRSSLQEVQIVGAREQGKPSHHRLNKARGKVERERRKEYTMRRTEESARTPAAIILSFWRAQRKKVDEYGRSSSHSHIIFLLLSLPPQWILIGQAAFFSNGSLILSRRYSTSRTFSELFCHFNCIFFLPTNLKPPHPPWIWSSTSVSLFSSFFMLTSVYHLLHFITCCVNYWCTLLLLLSCGYGGHHSVLLCMWVCFLHSYGHTLPKWAYVNKVRSNVHLFFSQKLY